jgi:calcineurin-like phosphoesterase family protein
LTEDEKEAISQRLQMIQEHIAEYPEVTITYFVPDKKKSGGAYKSVTGAVRKIDEYERVMVLNSHEVIPIDEILHILGELFNNLDTFSRL